MSNFVQDLLVEMIFCKKSTHLVINVSEVPDIFNSVAQINQISATIEKPINDNSNFIKQIKQKFMPMERS